MLTEDEVKDKIAEYGQAFVAIKAGVGTSYSDAFSGNLERFPADMRTGGFIDENLLGMLDVLGTTGRLVLGGI